MRDREKERKREAETLAEGEGGSLQGAWYGTRSWDPGITPQAKGSAKSLGHQGCLFISILNRVFASSILLPLNPFSRWSHMVPSGIEIKTVRDPTQTPGLYAQPPTHNYYPSISMRSTCSKLKSTATGGNGRRLNSFPFSFFLCFLFHSITPSST